MTRTLCIIVLYNAMKGHQLGNALLHASWNLGLQAEMAGYKLTLYAH